MEFVNRVSEQKTLIDILNRDKNSFTVIYGRRRLGKSTLLTRILGQQDLYFLADQAESKLQRELLATVIATIIPDFDKVHYPDWDVFFDMLNVRTDKRFTLCLDEFPYLVQNSPELPSIIQKKVDSKQLKFNLIICGSSQQLMYGLVLDATSPLYGRADAILKINPIKINYIGEALNLDAVSAIEEYAVWGGVPRYWELRENYSNLREAISNLMLTPNGVLYEEPIKLFKEDVKDIVKTATIISYIGAGVHRLSEIAARCAEPATNLSRPLSKLIQLGYLTKELPYGEHERNSKKSLYKIADQFLSFYFKFVAPYRSFIEMGRTQVIEQMIDNQMNSFVANLWEDLCRNAISGNEVDGVLYGMAHRWWGSVSKTEQIELDVVAESIDKKYLLVGECKWTSKENSDQLMQQLIAKANKLPFADKYIIVPKLFLKNEPTGSCDGVFLPQDILLLMNS